MTHSPGSTHSLRSVSLFARLPDDALDRIAQASPPRRYRKGQILCLEGDAGHSLYVLEEGHLRVSQSLPSGEETILAVIEAPAAVGELSLLDGAPRSATLTATTAIVVRTVGRAEFVALLREQPGLVMALMTTLAGIIRRSNERQVDLFGLDVPGRLAKWLLQRSESHGKVMPGGVAFQLGRSQGELAAELGTTRSTLNRTLKGFEEMDLITADGDAIVLADAERLRAFTS